MVWFKFAQDVVFLLFGYLCKLHNGFALFQKFSLFYRTFCPFEGRKSLRLPPGFNFLSFLSNFLVLKKALLPSFLSASLSKSAAQNRFSLFFIELFGFSLFFIEPPDFFLLTKCRIFESTKSVPEDFSLFFIELIESFEIFLSFLSNFWGQKCLIYAVYEDLTPEKARC